MACLELLLPEEQKSFKLLSVSAVSETITVVRGRSSVVEQQPFKPCVVGSIPTAPTKSLS